MTLRLIYSDYAVAFALAAAICALLSLYAWRRRRTPGEYHFALLMAAAATWAMANALENTMADASLKILFSKLSYLGIATIAPFWLLFSLEYCQRTRLLRSGWRPLIWVIPALAIVLVFTNEWHGLVWPTVTPVSDAPGSLVIYAHGPVVWLEFVYSFVLTLIGSIFLMGLAVESFRRFSLPATTVILGIVAPWVANLLYMTGYNPVPNLDITPFGFTITGLLLTWAIFGQRLFDLVPVAREKLVQMVSDGEILLDDRGDIVEINSSARRILGFPDGTGDPDIGSITDRLPALASFLRAEGNVDEEIVIGGASGQAWLEVSVTVLHDNVSRIAGRLVVLRDITKRKLAEEELRQSNEALKREVEEKARAQEALTASLHEKEILLKEIHHRVKNNLQIISSLLSLQTGSQDSNSNAVLKESQNRIRSMALIHEKLYRSADLARFDFREYVEALTIGLQRSYFPGPGVRLYTDVEHVSLDIDQAIPCGLIINELVSNSLKYAFPDGRAGEIHVGMIRDGGNYVLTVADNGVGLPPGTDFRNTPSLGLQLVSMLAGQLNGTVELDSAGGTRFKITFAEIGNR